MNSDQPSELKPVSLLPNHTKSWNTERLLVTGLIGGFLTYRVYQFRFEDSLFRTETFLALCCLGFLAWAWIIYRDFKQSSAPEDRSRFHSLVLGIGFIICMGLVHVQTRSIFNKSSLMKLSTVQNDFNGIGLDLKQNGSFILTNWSIGAEFHHGTYHQQGDTLSLSPDKSSGFPITTHLLFANETSGPNQSRIVKEIGEPVRNRPLATWLVISDHRQ